MSRSGPLASLGDEAQLAPNEILTTQLSLFGIGLTYSLSRLIPR